MNQESKIPNLPADEVSLPAISLDALARLQDAREEAYEKCREAVRRYSEELTSEHAMTAGFGPETRLTEIFHSLAVDLAHARATTYLAASGRVGAMRWKRAVCDDVLSELSQRWLHVIGDSFSCFACYPGLLGPSGASDLQAVIEATVEKVIEGSLSREELYQAFKDSRQLRSKSAVCDEIGVDRKRFDAWLSGKLPDSSPTSKRIVEKLKA